MLAKVTGRSGFTLIELAIVIVTLAIVGTVALLRIQEAMNTAKYAQTRAELDQLAQAIAGNPEIYVDGGRSDFGYVGDVGALPATLDDLAGNPGGYTTWQGPYIEAGPSGDDFKKDAWGAAYNYTGTAIASTGSGSPITRTVAAASADLLSNAVTGRVHDADMTTPGATFRDSLIVQLLYPNGAGAMTTATTAVDAGGSFLFVGIPIGIHTLRLVYTPDRDTIQHRVTVLPRETAKIEITFPADLW